MKIQNQRGFTLLELMIALTVGMILIGGTISMIRNSTTSLKQHEITSDVTSAIRLSLDNISHDVQSAGYFGRTRLPVDINGRTNGSNPLPSISGDCYPGFYADLQRYVFASNNTNPFASTCLSNVGYRAGTDVLVLRYADDRSLTATTPVGSLNANGLYLLSNPSGGTLFLGNSPPSITAFPREGNFAPDIGKRFYNAITHVYFVGNPPGDNFNQNALYRLELSLGSSTPFSPVLISSDIVDLQVMVGIEDCDPTAFIGAQACDGNIDNYVQPNGGTMELTGNLPSYGAISRIRTLSIGLTALSSRVEGANSMSTKTYRMRNQAYQVSSAATFQHATIHIRNSETLF